MFKGQIEVGEHRLEFGDVTHVMGVINVSPESRNSETVVDGPDEALALANRYRDWGAELVDVGGQSSHYAAPTIPAEVEIDRLLPVVEALVGDGFIVSVDTWKPEVAAAVVAAGSAIVNDTGGLKSEAMREVLARSGAGAVAVHVDGADPHAVGEVAVREDKAAYTAELFASLIAEVDAGLRSRLILDPGIAINYRGDYTTYTRLQLDVIRHASVFQALERPLLVPIPRKRAPHWVNAYITLALENGADMIRVHDVAVAADLVRLWGREVPA